MNLAKDGFNYSYNEETSRLHDMLLPSELGKTDGNLLKRLQSDTRVFRNGFTRSPISYNKLKVKKLPYQTIQFLKMMI